MLLKSLMQKNWQKPIHEVLIYANFSYICAPNPVRRRDHSRLERVKSYAHVILDSLSPDRFSEHCKFIMTREIENHLILSKKFLRVWSLYKSCCLTNNRDQLKKLNFTLYFLINYHICYGNLQWQNKTKLHKNTRAICEWGTD